MSPPSRRYYLDTSAYLRILLGEPGHESLIRELRGGELLSSSLLVLEATRNLMRLARERVLSGDDLRRALDHLEMDLEDFCFKDLTLDLCRMRSLPAISTPRSLDLAHLRTALWFHQETPLTLFVSVDHEQLGAARELGLPVRA